MALAERFTNVVPAVGIHPWEAGDATEEDVEAVARLAARAADRVRILGEVGIDKKFKPQTFDRQLPVFKRMLELAREYGMGVNLHAAGAWREALELVLKYEVSPVVFHWYTGPQDLIDEIAAQGYYISVNAAVKIQPKHQEIVKIAPLEILLTETDAPYEYHGLKLMPSMVSDAIAMIAELKGLSTAEVMRAVWGNFERLARKVGVKPG
ncbi:deoxyribonuclease [Candidatus Geothermarchaeota archaeon ex4572_27]|nr:MAG: deoxyribonuclease [Candidatus Geothermarchaeota archaeon ex4572_27]